MSQRCSKPSTIAIPVSHLEAIRKCAKEAKGLISRIAPTHADQRQYRNLLAEMALDQIEQIITITY